MSSGQIRVHGSTNPRTMSTVEYCIPYRLGPSGRPATTSEPDIAGSIQQHSWPSSFDTAAMGPPLPPWCVMLSPGMNSLDDFGYGPPDTGSPSPPWSATLSPSIDSFDDFGYILDDFGYSLDGFGHSLDGFGHSLDDFGYGLDDTGFPSPLPTGDTLDLHQISTLATFIIPDQPSETAKWTNSRLALHCPTPLDTPSSSHPFICCNTKFANASTFKRHRRERCQKLLSAPKPYTCGHCRRGFCRRWNLKQHLVEVEQLRHPDADDEIRRNYPHGMRRQRAGGRRI